MDIKKEHLALIKAARVYAKAVRALSELDGSERAKDRALEALKDAALKLEFRDARYLS